MTITAMEPSSDTMDPLSLPPTAHRGHLLEPGQPANVEATGDNHDEDDDVTVIILEHGLENQNHSAWADQNSPELEERTLFVAIDVFFDGCPANQSHLDNSCFLHDTRTPKCAPARTSTSPKGQLHPILDSMFDSNISFASCSDSCSWRR